MTVEVVRFTVAGENETPAAAIAANRPYTVVYDGACRICGKLANVLKKWDRHRQIEVIPAQTSGIQARFPWIPAQAYRDALQMIGPGGRTWQGAAAVEQILDVLPKGRLIGWVFSIPFARPLADRFYRWFARNRYKLGCGEHCQLRGENLRFD